MAFRDCQDFVELLSRELAVFNDMTLTKSEGDQLLSLTKGLVKNFPDFETEMTFAVKRRLASNKSTPCYADMLRVLTHAMAIADRNNNSASILLLRIVSTMVLNGCEANAIESVLVVLNEPSTKTYITSFLLANFSNSGCVNTIVRLYQNIFSFLLSELDCAEAVKNHGICIVLPIGLVEVFAITMHSFDLFEMRASPTRKFNMDLDEACSVWNSIIRLLSTTVDYYERLIDHYVREMESFKGADLTYFDCMRTHAEKLLAVLDHVGDEIVSNFVRPLQTIVVLDDSGSVVAMIAQMKVYAPRILNHFDSSSKNLRSQRAMKDRICRAVAKLGDVYI